MNRFSGTQEAPTWDTEEVYDRLANIESIFRDVMSKVAIVDLINVDVFNDTPEEFLGGLLQNEYESYLQEWNVDADKVDWATIADWFMDEE